LRVTRRRFTFWLSFGLFSLAEKLRMDSLDVLAAEAMRQSEPATPIDPSTTPVHWRAAENKTWRWFERENLVNGRWKLTGITTPIHKHSGNAHEGPGYLDEVLVPVEVRHGKREEVVENISPELLAEFAKHQPSEERRGRHGRPPSRWLRNLHADEIRIWLRTIEVPEAGVEGMTYWTHLTRDHSFDPDKIEGLTEDEQAKLHAAAHFGY
jgi:hypothetical protein